MGLPPKSRVVLALGFALLTVAASVGGGAVDTDGHWLTPADDVALEPTATRDAAGRTWVAWLDFDAQRSRGPAVLVCAVLDGTRELARATISTQAGLALPKAVPFGDGIACAWEATEAGLPAVFSGTLHFSDGAITGTPAVRVSPPEAPALAPILVATGTQRLEMVWQVHRDGDYDIAHAVAGPGDDGPRWSEPRFLVETPGVDEWGIRAVAGGGDLHVVFDRFVGDGHHDGEGDDPGSSFDVHYLRARRGVVEEQRLVAGGPLYQAYPDVAVDAAGHPWVAWEEAERFGIDDALRRRRTTRLARLEEGGLRQVDLGEEHASFPRLFANAGGLLLTRRVRTRLDIQGRKDLGRSFYSAWRTEVLTFGDGAAAQVLVDSDGDNEPTEALFPGAENGVACVLLHDGRVEASHPEPMQGPLEGRWRLRLRDLPAPTGLPSAEVLGPLRRLGSAPSPVAHGTRATGPYFGDLHRHTHLSRCAGATEGTLEDAYRYARGPGGLDFMAVTDHFQHLTPWSWWRSVREVDRRHAEGRLVAFVGLECVLPGQGHANLIHVGGGAASLHAGLAATPPVIEFSPKSDIMIPHMTGDIWNPAPWSSLNPKLHRLVEIHQGRRGSYESMDGPYVSEDLTTPAKGFDRIHAEGKHFGLISSSDHSSSSSSYAGVHAASLTRDAIFAGLRSRRTFASTARVEAEASIGRLRMGAHGVAPADAPLVIRTPRTPGRAPVASVDVLKNGQVLAHVDGADAPATTGAPGDGSELVVVTTQLRRRPDDLRVRVEDGTLLEARLRRPHPMGEGLVVEGNGARLARRGGWVDIVLRIRPDGEATRVVVERGEVRGELALAEVAPGTSHRIPGADKEWLWRIGPSLGRAELELEVPDPGRAPGDTYYARIAFEDGNVLWTSPILVRRFE